jgi:hypothetical protein
MAAEQVALVLTVDGRVASIWASKEAAEAHAAKYNADPFMALGEPDPDAPYSVQVWRVTDGG